METYETSRRAFLIQSLGRFGGAWLATNWPQVISAHQHARHASAANPPAKFEFFTPEQAAEVEAIAAQIIPTDSTPGAREALVIHFIDRALATFDRDKQPLYIRGLADLQRRCAQKHPEAGRFSDLPVAQQIELLQAIEQTEFFEQARIHTIVGFFTNPEYGGNFQQAGWKLIGFEDEGSFEPPFGYYDRKQEKNK